MLQVKYSIVWAEHCILNRTCNDVAKTWPMIAENKINNSFTGTEQHCNSSTLEISA